MKYFVTTLVLTGLLFGTVQAKAEEPIYTVKAYAADTQPANLNTTAKPPAKKAPAKKKTTKKPAKKKTTKKPAAKKPAKPKKTAAKKTTKKVAKVKKPKAPKVSTTVDTVEGADLGADANVDLQDTEDPLAKADVVNPNPELPQASPQPKGNPAVKALSIASIDGASGLGLVYLLKKMFLP
jgi:hypothetical protein